MAIPVSNLRSISSRNIASPSARATLGLPTNMGFFNPRAEAAIASGGIADSIRFSRMKPWNTSVGATPAKLSKVSIPSATGGGGLFGKVSNMFGANNLSKAQGAGISLAGSLVNKLGNSLISDGMSTRAGNAVANIGNTVGGIVGNFNPVLGGIISAGTGIIGGVVNRGFGYSVANENAMKSNATRLGGISVGDNFGSMVSATSNLGLQDPGRVRNGWFNNKGTKMAAALMNNQYNAQSGVLGKVYNAGINIDRSMDRNIMSNYAALGGALDLMQHDDYIGAINRRSNAMYNRGTQLPMASMMAFGGELGTNGTDFTNGLLYVDEGGTHETNPYQGVQMGVDENGTPNLVEEGETVFNNYVFSNRMKVPQEVYRQFGLGGNLKDGITFAEASKKMARESEERPNDPISIEGLNESLGLLASVQEAQRQKEQAENAIAQYAYGGLKDSASKGETSEKRKAAQAEREMSNASFTVPGNFGNGIMQDSMGDNSDQYPDYSDYVTFNEAMDAAYTDAISQGVNPENYIFIYGDRMYTAADAGQSSQQFAYGGPMGNIYEGIGEDSQVLDRTNDRDFFRRMFGDTTAAILDDAVNFVTDPVDYIAGDQIEAIMNKISKMTEPQREKFFNTAIGQRIGDIVIALDSTPPSSQYVIEAKSPSFGRSMIKGAGTLWKAVVKSAKKTKDTLSKLRQTSKEFQEELDRRAAGQQPKRKRGRPKKSETAAAASTEGGSNMGTFGTLAGLLGAGALFGNGLKSWSNKEKAENDSLDNAYTTDSIMPEYGDSIASGAYPLQNDSVPGSNRSLEDIIKADEVNRDVLYPKHRLEDPYNIYKGYESTYGPNTFPIMVRNGAVHAYDSSPQATAGDIMYDQNMVRGILSNTRQQTPTKDMSNPANQVNVNIIPQEGFLSQYPNYSRNKAGSMNEAMDYYTALAQLLGGSGGSGGYGGYGGGGTGYYPGATAGNTSPSDTSVKGPEIIPELKNGENSRVYETLDGNIGTAMRGIANTKLGNPWEENASKEALLNGDKDIESPVSNINDPSNVLPHYPTWMRYVPAFGAGIMSITDALGLTNNPDYTYADKIEAAANAAGYTPNVQFTPIGNYKKYNPMDITYGLNKLAAQSGATDRSIQNTAGTKGAAMAGILANGNNTQTATGNLYRQALEYNDSLQKQVEEFNRDIDKYNSQMGLEAAIANARYQQAGRQLRLAGLGQAASLRDAIDQRLSAAKAANLTNLFNSLGNIGRENFAFNQINASAPANNNYGINNAGDIMHAYFDALQNEYKNSVKSNKKKNKNGGTN